MASIAQEIADRVAATILRKGRSKLSVADDAGIPQTTFSRKIAGKSEFTMTELVSVARAIDVPPSTFLPSAFEAVA